jgi:hypothetical protein
MKVILETYNEWDIYVLNTCILKTPKDFPEYNYLQYVLAYAMKWYNMYIICIEKNKHRMIIYTNVSRDNIRKKRKENKYFWRCVLVL